jgi:hypothetical protein
MVLLRGNWTRSIRWKVIVSSRRLLAAVSRIYVDMAGMGYMSWKRMLARSSALEASERSMASMFL